MKNRRVFQVWQSIQWSWRVSFNTYSLRRSQGKRPLTVTVFSRNFDLFLGRTGSLEPLTAKKSSSFSFRDKDTKNFGHWNKSMSTFPGAVVLSWCTLSSVLALTADWVAGDSAGAIEAVSGFTSGWSECNSVVRTVLASHSRLIGTWLLEFRAAHVAPVPSASL